MPLGAGGGRAYAAAIRTSERTMATSNPTRRNLKHSTAQRCAAIAVLACTALAAQAAHAADPKPKDDAFRAGIEARAATADDIGMPVYPGAVPQVDRDKDGKEGSSVKLGLWAGAFGMNLAVQKFASRDPLDTVAAYYRQALAPYGAVLDCSGPAAKRPAPNPKDKNALRCDDDSGQANDRVYKVGRKNNFRLVALQPVASGVHFQLLRLQLPND
jgi:hypothetical protein